MSAEKHDRQLIEGKGTDREAVRKPYAEPSFVILDTINTRAFIGLALDGPVSTSS